MGVQETKDYGLPTVYDDDLSNSELLEQIDNMLALNSSYGIQRAVEMQQVILRRMVGG